MMLYKFYKNYSFAQLKKQLQQRINKRNISTSLEYGSITYKLYGRRLILFYSPSDEEQSQFRVVFTAVVKEKTKKSIQIIGTFGILPRDFILIAFLMTAIIYLKTGTIYAVVLAFLLTGMYFALQAITSITKKGKKYVIDFLNSLNV